MRRKITKLPDIPLSYTISPEDYNEYQHLKEINSDLLAACEDTEFLLRKLAINPKELPQMMGSIKRAAADLKEVLSKAKGEL